MPASLPDIYVATVSEGIALQGATQRGIDYLRNHRGPLASGTIAVIATEQAEEAFAGIDAAGLQTKTIG